MSEVILSTDETRVSYGIGRQLGDQLRDNPPPGVSLDAILAGLTDAFAGKPSRVSQEEMAASFKVIREIMRPKPLPRLKRLLVKVWLIWPKTASAKA
jgi:FKBP-type peptidyl-prolyl cis-trans isomerase FklB